MKITIRAFTESGYHKDIAILNDKQLLMHDNNLKEPIESLMSGLIGHGVSICPEDFPDVVKFEVVVQPAR